jgi:ADP-dependent phosphofructokinase/glucokinase
MFMVEDGDTISGMFVTSPTTSRCSNPRTESTSTNKNRENTKSARIAEFQHEVTCTNNQNCINVYREQTSISSETNYKIPIKRKEEFQQLDEKWNRSSEQVFSNRISECW